MVSLNRIAPQPGNSLIARFGLDRFLMDFSAFFSGLYDVSSFEKIGRRHHQRLPNYLTPATLMDFSLT
jgi:hypothetical protein